MDLWANKAVFSSRDVSIWNFSWMATWKSFSPNKEIANYEGYFLHQGTYLISFKAFPVGSFPLGHKNQILSWLIDQEIPAHRGPHFLWGSGTFFRREGMLDSGKGLLTMKCSESWCVPGSEHCWERQWSVHIPFPSVPSTAPWSHCSVFSEWKKLENNNLLKSFKFLQECQLG